MEKYPRKTLYSITFRMIGVRGISIMWTDSREKAYEMAKRDGFSSPEEHDYVIGMANRLETRARRAGAWV